MHLQNLKTKAFVFAVIHLQLAIYVFGSTASPRNICLQRINTARAQYAENHRIANMNALRYNKYYERDIIEHISNDSDCSKPFSTHKNGLDIFWNFENIDELGSKMLSDPGRAMMACVKKTCKNTGRNVVSIAVDASVSPIINGTPGSKCSKLRNPQTDKLCSLQYQRKFLDKAFSFVGSQVQKVFKFGIDKAGEVIADAGAAVFDMVKEKALNVVSDAVDKGINILEQESDGILKLCVPVLRSGKDAAFSSGKDISFGGKGNTGPKQEGKEDGSEFLSTIFQISFQAVLSSA